MLLMEITSNFTSQEFLPKVIHDVSAKLIYNIMDERIIKIAQRVRDAFGPMYINTWHVWKDNARNWSGFRPYQYYEDKVKYGLPITSQHHFGRAVDMIPGPGNSNTVEEMREYIIDNHLEKFPELTAIEMSVNWLHLDCRNPSRERLLKFYP